AVWAFRGHIACVGPRRNDSPFIETSRPRDVAMQFNARRTAGSLVQTINILCDQAELRKYPLHLNDSEMRSVRICIGDELTAPFVPFPDQARVAAESARSRQILGTVIRP